jgi:cyclic pyranopterin phosphate synthase
MEGEERQSPNAVVEMTPSEVATLVRMAVRLGISRVKLTGGEPLMRKDITEIVKKIASIHGLEDLSMTTNGSLLAPLAAELHADGLKRVNISLPTLDADVFRKVTGGRLENTLRGIRAAVDAGFDPVKLNMLVLMGVNDAAVEQMIRFAGHADAVLQLIELEPLNISPSYYSAYHVSLDSYEWTLGEKAVKVETRRYMQNRRVYYLPDARVEVIRPIENTEFCMRCTRLRVTSDGKLKPCLMRNGNLVDFLGPMRIGATEHELARLIEQANDRREPFSQPLAVTQASRT